MTKTWTIAACLDMGLQALGDHLEAIMGKPGHDLLYTKQLKACVEALVTMAEEERAARDPRNAAKGGDDLIAGIVELMRTDPEVRAQVEQAMRGARAS